MSSHDFQPMSRRRFLRSSALGAGALAMPVAPFVARAAELKKVSFTLDWLFQGASAGFLIAKEKGYFSDGGLDVSIIPGKGSGTTAQLVAAKATLIGFSGWSLWSATASPKALAIKTVASIYRRTTRLP